ncbi:hypothetical protein LCGC14_3049900, partial [marine sediment metagenome]
MGGAGFAKRGVLASLFAVFRHKRRVTRRFHPSGKKEEKFALSSMRHLTHLPARIHDEPRKGKQDC